MASNNRFYTCDICGDEFETPGAKGGHKRAHQIKTSREELQEELQRLAETSGRTPTTKMMDERGSYSAACVKLRFGSWGDALRSIGLRPNNRYDITPAEVRADIREVAEELGHPPTSTEHREIGEYSVSHAQDTFGSWNEALQAAGFEPHREIRISDEVLLKEIHGLVDRLGKVPTASEMCDHGRFSHRPYFRRWDGWQSAVRAAGYEPVGRPAGPDNYNWKEQPAHGWREYGANWEEQRQKALDRDDYVCQTPGCDRTQEEHLEEFTGGLHVHHIRPLSTFGEDESEVSFERANRLDNLVTVCVEHHHLWERVSPLRLDIR